MRQAINAAVGEIDIDELAAVVEREVLHGLMLGALDALTEREQDEERHTATLARVLLDKKAPFAIQPFEVALEWFQSKDVLPPDVFAALTAAAKKRAFTIAGLAREDLLQLAHDELSRIIESGRHAMQTGEGPTLRDFKRFMTDRIESAGWTPKNKSHVETIYRTNVMGAYGAGRLAESTQPAVLAARPFWQWRCVGDSRTRPAHKAAHNVILPASDPFWQRAYPPAGYNCRCRVISRSARWVEANKASIGPVPAGLPDPGWSGVAASIPAPAPLPKSPAPLKPAVPFAPPLPVAPPVRIPPPPPPPHPNDVLKELQAKGVVQLKPAPPPGGLVQYQARMRVELAKLKPSEKDAVAKYTGAHYSAVRAFERGLSQAEVETYLQATGKGAANAKIIAEETAQMIPALVGAVSKMAPVSDVLVYRGIRDLDRATWDKLLVQSEFDLQGTSSASHNAQVAMDFSRPRRVGTYGAVFRIQHKSGVAIEGASSVEHEREVLIPKGARFKVVGRALADDYGQGRTLLIDLEEI